MTHSHETPAPHGAPGCRDCGAPARRLFVGQCRRELAVPAGGRRDLRQRRRRRSGGAGYERGPKYGSHGTALAGAGRGAGYACAAALRCRLRRRVRSLRLARAAVRGRGPRTTRGRPIGRRSRSPRNPRRLPRSGSGLQADSLPAEPLPAEDPDSAALSGEPAPAPLPDEPELPESLAGGEPSPDDHDDLRTDEVVARIWIAPFVDADGSIARRPGSARCWSRPAGGSDGEAPARTLRGTGGAGALVAAGDAGRAACAAALARLGRVERDLRQRRERRLRHRAAAVRRGSTPRPWARSPARSPTPRPSAAPSRSSIGRARASARPPGPGPSPAAMPAARWHAWAGGAATC